MRNRISDFVIMLAVSFCTLLTASSAMLGAYLAWNIYRRTYTATYIAGFLPSGELVSSVTVLFCLVVTGVVAFLGLMKNGKYCIFAVADAVLKILSVGFFALKIKSLILLWGYVTFAFVYLLLSVAAVVFVKQKKVNSDKN